MSPPSPPSTARLTRILFFCEIRRLLRDRRALFAGVLLPALLYPAMFWSQGRVENVAKKLLSSKEITLTLSLEDLGGEMEERVRAQLEEGTLTTLADLPSGADLSALWLPTGGKGRAGAIADLLADGPTFDRDPVRELLGETHALLAGRAQPGEAGRWEFRIFYDVQSDDSREARGRARTALNSIETELEDARLAGLPDGDPAAHLAFESLDVASAQDKSGAGLGRLLPIFSLLMLLSGGAFAALGAFAGEREGKTLETLLVQPIPTRSVALGKYGAVLTAGMVTLAVNLLSLVGCAWAGLVKVPGLEDGPMTLTATRFLAAVVYLPACALVCALLSLFCGRARSYREGQFTLFPLSLIAVLPTLVVLRPDLEATPLLAAVPFAGPALLLRDALSGNLAVLSTVVMVASHGLWTWLVLSRLSGVLDGERTLAGNDLTAESGRRALAARHGKVWAFVGVLAVYLVGQRLQQWNLPWGLALTLWGLMPLLTLLCLRRRPGTAAEGTSARLLSFTRPHGAHVLGALFLIPGLAVLMTKVYLPFQSEILPLPESIRQAGDLLKPLTDLPGWLLLFLLAISPAICEELFFRGVVLGCLRRGLTPLRALLWQAFFFAAAHVSLYRLAPTAALGLLLGALTLRTRSILPAMLVHAGYNALVILGGSEGMTFTEHTYWVHTSWLVIPGLLLLRIPARRSGEGPAGPRRV